MFIAAFVLQFGLHVLTAGMAFTLGARLLEGGTAGLPVLATLTVLAAQAWLRSAPRSAGVRRPVGGRRAEARSRSRSILSRHDALTGLANRAAFCERLRTALGGARRDDRSSAVLRVDLADFKAINETLGCVAGDLLLRHSGTRLLAVLRESDMLARVGADEFAILQSGVAAPADAADLADRLLAALAEPFELCGQLTHVGARIGIALAPGDGADAETAARSTPVWRSVGPRPGRRATVRFFEERDGQRAARAQGAGAGSRPGARARRARARVPAAVRHPEPAHVRGRGAAALAAIRSAAGSVPTASSRSPRTAA